MYCQQALNRGVPQGSVLGPILFILFFDGIGTILVGLAVNYLLFADDLVIYSNDTDINNLMNKLNVTLQNINNWCTFVGLKLKLDKTTFMILHSRYDKTIPDNLNLQCNGEIINRVYEYKYLGVIIDSNMLFNKHFESVQDRFNSAIGALMKIRRCLKYNVLAMVISSFCLSITDYVNNIWGPTKINELPKLQKKINCLLAVHQYPRLMKYYIKSYWKDGQNAVKRKALALKCEAEHKSVNYCNLLERANL